MMEHSGVDNLKNFIKELEQHKLFIICRCEASHNFSNNPDNRFLFAYYIYLLQNKAIN